jgi:hypothetical protein
MPGTLGGHFTLNYSDNGNQRCGTVTIFYGSGSDFLKSYGSGSDLRKVLVPTFENGSGYEFLASYGSGSPSQKVTVPTVPVPQR